jgi:hypothetical protein
VIREDVKMVSAVTKGFWVMTLCRLIRRHSRSLKTCWLSTKSELKDSKELAFRVFTYQCSIWGRHTEERTEGFRPHQQCKNSRSSTSMKSFTKLRTIWCTVCWGKGGRYVELTILPPSFADSLEILETSTTWSSKGLSRPLMGCLL